ncbi:MAG: NADH-quinone oxidoreductase subunit D [Actinomycetes bacterium]
MSGAQDVVIGIGIGGGGRYPASPESTLDLGVHHPSAHGLLRLHLRVDGEHIVSADPEIGFMHRGAEKLMEVRDYRQGLVLANRHDWLSAFAGELGLALTVEHMLGLAVPQRAIWLRTLLAEVTRVFSHLSFLGSFPVGTGTPSPASFAFQERDAVAQLLEEISGGRLHLMLTRIGGLRADAPEGWLERASSVVTQLRARVDSVAGFIDDQEFRDHARGIGIITAEQVLAYGVTGPIARAAGVDLDLRRDEPYLAYGELTDVLKVVTRDTGDCLARAEVIRDQLVVSLDLIAACVQRLNEMAPGPVNVPLPKTLRAPEGSHYCWTESPLGISGYLVVSRGERTPWRVKMRTPSFNNLAALGEVLAGTNVASLTTIVGSMYYVIGDVDR